MSASLDDGEHGDGYEEAMGHMMDEIDEGQTNLPRWWRDLGLLDEDEG